MKRIALLFFSISFALVFVAAAADERPKKKQARRGGEAAKAAPGAARNAAQARRFAPGAQRQRTVGNLPRQSSVRPAPRLRNNAPKVNSELGAQVRGRTRGSNAAAGAASPKKGRTFTPRNRTAAPPSASANPAARARVGRDNDGRNRDWAHRDRDGRPGDGRGRDDHDGRDRDWRNRDNDGHDRDWRNRRHDRRHHDRNWYRRNYTRFVLVGGGYYYWNANAWYPAYGYDPYYNSYAYDGPIYAYNDLPPDQVVASVQAELQRLGYYRGAVDGAFGPLTREALAGYQNDRGLPVTAEIDEQTLGALGLL